MEYQGGQLLVLPYPPSLNRYYRTFQGRVLIAKDGREYRKQVAAMLHDRCGAKPEPLRGALQCSLEAYMPDNRRRDLDNLLKAMLDALTHGGVWEDDSQVEDLRITKCGVDKADPRVVAMIEPLMVGL